MTEGIIQYEDFVKIDLRVARILKVEEIDAEIYKLYGIKKEEQKIIEESLK